MGEKALLGVTTGSYNIGFGTRSGQSITTGSNNVNIEITLEAMQELASLVALVWANNRDAMALVAAL